MTPDNVDALLAVLRQIASSLTLANKYTITGAADWPILASVGGAIAILIGFMWRDNRAGMRDIKSDIAAGMKEIRRESRSDVDAVWSAVRDCQHDCCPRKKDQ